MVFCMIMVYMTINIQMTSGCSSITLQLVQCAVEVSKVFFPEGSSISVMLHVPSRSQREKREYNVNVKIDRPNEKRYYGNCSDNKTRYYSFKLEYFGEAEEHSPYITPKNQQWKLIPPIRKFSSSYILDYFLRLVNFNQSWKFYTHVIINQWDKLHEKLDGFIIFLNSDQLHYEITTYSLYIKSNFWFPKPKIMVIIIGINPDLLPVFNFLDKYSLYGSIIISENESRDVIVSSWIADNCGSFSQSYFFESCTSNIFSITKQNYTVHLPPNFNTCSLAAFGVHNPPFSVNSDDMNLTLLDGVDFKIIEIIAHYMGLRLNSTTHYVPESYDYIGSNINLESEKKPITYLQRYYTQTFAWFVPCAKTNIRWSSLTRVFSADVWFCFLASFIFISLAMQDSFNAWAIFLNVAVYRRPSSMHMRLLFMSWVLFSYSFVMVFQTYMTSCFTDPGRQHQIDSLEEVLTSDLNLVVDMSQDDSWHIMMGNRKHFFMFAYDTVNMLRFTSEKPNTAVLTSEEVFLYNYPRMCERNGTSEFYMVRNGAMSVHMTFVIDKSSRYIPFINRIIIRLVESGVVNKIVENYVDPTGLKKGISIAKHVPKSYGPLSKFQMFSTFLYLWIGFLLSFVVFFGELLVGGLHGLSRFVVISIQTH
ncbi:Ionotropic receptor 780 [Blattella germanica]|nr:Ionotropic receptor 780 [Blattella germanica]